jgi:hypothetical protein
MLELYRYWYNYVNIKVEIVENKSHGEKRFNGRIKINFRFFRVFLGLCENEKYRGPIVAAGGAKVSGTNILIR